MHHTVVEMGSLDVVVEEQPSLHQRWELRCYLGNILAWASGCIWRRQYMKSKRCKCYQKGQLSAPDKQAANIILTSNLRRLGSWRRRHRIRSRRMSRIKHGMFQPTQSLQHTIMRPISHQSRIFNALPEHLRRRRLRRVTCTRRGWIPYRLQNMLLPLLGLQLPRHLILPPLTGILAIHTAQLAIRARLETIAAAFLVATAHARHPWLGPLMDHHHGVGLLPVIHVWQIYLAVKWVG